MNKNPSASYLNLSEKSNKRNYLITNHLKANADISGLLPAVSGQLNAPVGGPESAFLLVKHGCDWPPIVRVRPSCAGG